METRVCNFIIIVLKNKIRYVNLISNKETNINLLMTISSFGGKQRIEIFKHHNSQAYENS